MTTLTILQLTERVDGLLQRHDYFTAWLGGAANGGPTNNGLFPLILNTGAIVNLTCPARLVDMVAGPAAAAAASAAAAAASASSITVDVAAVAANATAAQTAATNAATSATGAATSATNAANSASGASTSATNAAASATAAAGSATTANTRATAANTSATAAAGSATGAATSATAAAASATAAASSATTASGAASGVATNATAAQTAATNAANSATAAQTSATGAATSATNAATSATSAAGSATTATTGATNAANSATAAAGSATAAGTSATNAAASAAAAAASAGATVASNVAATALAATALAGVGSNYSRFDHVHPLPSPREVGIRDGDNRIINGDMRVNQRAPGTLSATVAAGRSYAVDNVFGLSGGTTSGVFSLAQVAGGISPPGYSHHLLATITTADAMAGAGAYHFVACPVEGSNILDLGFGAAGALPVFVRFLVRVSISGTFGGAFFNTSGSRCFPFSFAATANTWQTVTISIPGDVTGTWPTGNEAAAFLCFSLGCNASLKGTAGAWAGSLFRDATATANLIATNGATMAIAGVRLVQSARDPGNLWRSIGDELALCQRYRRIVGAENWNAGSAGGAIFLTMPVYHWGMRAQPVAALINAGTLSNLSTVNIVPQSAEMSRVEMTTAAAGASNFFGRSWLLSADL